MQRLLFWGFTGVLAAMALHPDMPWVLAFGFGTFLGPVSIPLIYLALWLPSLWLAGASFDLIYSLTRRAIPNQWWRALASGVSVAGLFAYFFVLSPLWTAEHRQDRAANILAGDMPPPGPFSRNPKHRDSHAGHPNHSQSAFRAL